MTTVKMQSSNGSFFVWPEKNSESETATLTFYQGIFALLLRVGFIFIQIGCIPTERVYLMLMQNILDIFVTLPSFGLLGFMIAYGKKSFKGIIGYGSWISSEDAPLNEGVRGFAAALTGSAIMTTLLSTRLHYIAQVVISFVFSGLVLPILLHSSTIYNGWMIENKLEDVYVSFQDTATVLATSVAGSTAAIVGCAVLGRRMLRVRDLDAASIGPTSSGTAICGYFFVLIGLVALALPSPVVEEMQSSVDFDVVLVVRAIISVATGTLTVFTLHLMFYRNTVTYWIVLKFLQGGLASFVTISAAYNLYSVPMCAIVASIGAVCFFFTSEFLFSTTVDDNCNIISVHFICGILSCLLPPFFGSKANIGFPATFKFYLNVIHLAWQVVCCFAAVILVGVIFSLVFFILSFLYLLRNNNEKLAHDRANRVKKEKEKIAASEPVVEMDYILPSVDHKELECAEMKTFTKLKVLGDGDYETQKQNIVVNAQNVNKTPFDFTETNKFSNAKFKRALKACKSIKKRSGVITKTKRQTQPQKRDNVDAKNPFHDDDSLQD